ncbi:hypothetical protein [Brevundimonas sp.]|uniref:hypothetical protein n=1 Tax=Brevundimonas sp. TaxID=1871086 RepID=UPI0027308859|nr:hypothetical protein [Brevundimonas sp.]MDP1913226.1 hypothetical protein [Brevundimonas sp.]
METDTARIRELSLLILRYVASRPGACDSLEGICDWWLMRQRRDESRRNVAAALALLVASGQIETRQGVDGQVVYRAARQAAL